MGKKKILTQTNMCVAEYFESEVLILHRVAAFKSPFTEREGKVKLTLYIKDGLNVLPLI